MLIKFDSLDFPDLAQLRFKVMLNWVNFCLIFTYFRSQNMFHYYYSEAISCFLHFIILSYYFQVPMLVVFVHFSSPIFSESCFAFWVLLEYIIRFSDWIWPFPHWQRNPLLFLDHLISILQDQHFLIGHKRLLRPLWENHFNLYRSWSFICQYWDLSWGLLLSKQILWVLPLRHQKGDLKDRYRY